MYTQFRPKIRGKLWLLCYVYIFTGVGTNEKVVVWLKYALRGEIARSNEIPRRPPDVEPLVGGV